MRRTSGAARRRRRLSRSTPSEFRAQAQRVVAAQQQSMLGLLNLSSSSFIRKATCFWTQICYVQTRVIIPRGLSLPRRVSLIARADRRNSVLSACCISQRFLLVSKAGNVIRLMSRVSSRSDLDIKSFELYTSASVLGDVRFRFCRTFLRVSARINLLHGAMRLNHVSRLAIVSILNSASLIGSLTSHCSALFCRSRRAKTSWLTSPASR